MSTEQHHFAATLPVPESELDIDQVLLSGQTFRWKKDADGWWTNIIAHDVRLRVQRNQDQLTCESTTSEPHVVLNDYFRLDVSLNEMKRQWLDAGEVDLVDSMTRVQGLRIVRQEPFECLISFLCSSAAPIHRIRRSVSGLCTEYGEVVQPTADSADRCFPGVAALCSASRSDLDRLGLGFRGRYVIDASRQVYARGGEAWLMSLRDASYEEAKLALMELPGVGEKVADCVCLFSLDKDQAVPLDVHMARVARRLFPDLGITRSLTPRIYAMAADSFRARFGPYAGWAQQYFFYDEIAKRGLWDQNISRHRSRQTSTAD